MRPRDMIRVCLKNMLRRKSRTMLTVLGVVIGCCSIVIMISIGIGMKESQRALLEQMGDLTIISVYPPSSGSAKKKLDQKAVQKFGRFPGVTAVSPKLSPDDVTIRFYAGGDRRYAAAYASVAGMDRDALTQLGFALESGSPLDSGDTSALVGQYFAYGFMDTRKPEGSNMVDLYSMYQDDGTVGEPPAAYFDPLETPVTMEISAGGDEKKVTAITLNVTGKMKENYSKGEETSQGVIMDRTALAALIAKARADANLPAGKGKSFASVLVKVKDIQQVEDVEKRINQMGFQTSSMESIRKPMEQEARQKQMLLGGMGAVSLLVAAIGITNTMIMSISERTREIGVMKSLGCYVNDIRGMFLMEAGAIGLVGGIIGAAVSALASVVMNVASAKIPILSPADLLAVLTAPGGRMSVIPLWLIGFAVVFSIFIGLGSGYYPANKAVRISALEAIKES